MNKEVIESSGDTNKAVPNVKHAAAGISGIRDNYLRGAVGEFLLERMRDGSDLSVVSAYFTIYAFGALQKRLVEIDRMRFLFGEPRFLQSLDPERTDKKAFKIEDEGLQLANRLQQKRLARECADWINRKAEIRSVRETALMHGKMYHLSYNGIDDAILGSSNFTLRGLGLGSANNNIELNLEVDSNRDRRDLKAWFEEIWNNLELVEDVKPEVLRYLQQLYVNHAPEFIYFKTLYHVFERFLAAQHEGGLLFENTQIVETEIWRTLFEFQKDAVKGAINKINAHNGCIIADSVGLPAPVAAAVMLGEQPPQLTFCTILIADIDVTDGETVKLKLSATVAATVTAGENATSSAIPEAAQLLGVPSVIVGCQLPVERTSWYASTLRFTALSRTVPLPPLKAPLPFQSMKAPNTRSRV